MIRFKEIIFELEKNAKDFMEKRKDSVFKENKDKYEKKIIKENIEITSNIKTGVSSYKEDIIDAEKIIKDELKADINIKTFKINKSYLSIIPDSDDERMSELYLVFDVSVERIEKDREFKNRVLVNSGISVTTTLTDFILKDMEIKIEDRKLIINYLTESYEFDVKIQDMNELNILDKKELYRKLKMKEKQIFLK